MKWIFHVMFSSSQLHAFLPCHVFLLLHFWSRCSLPPFLFLHCNTGRAVSGMQCAKRSVSVPPLARMLQDKAGVRAAAGDLGVAAGDLNEVQTLCLPLLQKCLRAGLGFLSKSLLLSSFFPYLITLKNKLVFTRKQNHSALAICCCLAGERSWSWKSIPERSTSFSSSNYSIDRLTCNCLLPLWQLKLTYSG